MAFLDEAFDVNSLPEQQDFAPLPEGWYTASIAGAEVKETKDKLGKYIAVRYDILGPTHQGRVVFGNINIRNKSSQAQNIGMQQLGSIMRSIGLTRVDNSDQLIGGSLQIKLTIREQDGYEPTNNVTGFKAINGGAMPKAETQQAQQPSASSEPKSAAPWAKR